MHIPFKDRLAQAAKEAQRQQKDRYVRETPWWERILIPVVFWLIAIIEVAIVSVIEIGLVALIIALIWWLIGCAFPALPPLTLWQCVHIACAIKLVTWFLIPKKK